MAIVEVKPIERKQWHRKAGQESFSRPVTIEALYSLRTGRYATGLSNEKRAELEEKTSFDLSDNYIQGKAHPFWGSPMGRVKLDNKTNIFDTEKELDFIRLQVLKASDLVANSQKEYEEGLFPEARFIIFDEQEEVEIRASKAAAKRKVIIEAAKLSKQRKAELIQILMGLSVRGRSDDFIDLKLDEAIESKGPDTVLRLIKRDKKKTAIHSFVLECIYKGVLRKAGTAVFYMEDQLGFDVEATVDYFIDPANQALKAQLIEKLG